MSDLTPEMIAAFNRYAVHRDTLDRYGYGGATTADKRKYTRLLNKAMDIAQKGTNGSEDPVFRRRWLDLANRFYDGVQTNPRPRKYASASERQAAYRDRAPEVCFRAEPKTVETLDRIADTIDRSRAELLLSMTKFALTNHDWERFGLTHKTLPRYEENPTVSSKIQWKSYTIPGSEDTVYQGAYKGYLATVRKKGGVWSLLLMKDNKTRTPLGIWDSNNGQASGAKAWFEIVVDDESWKNLKGNPVKTTRAKRTPTPAQLAARERFAEAARSGAFKKAGGRKANPAKKTHVWRITVFDDDGRPAKVTTDSEEQGALLYAKSKADANMAGEIHYILPKSERLEFWFDGSGIHRAGTYGDQPIYTTRRAALRSNPAAKSPSTAGGRVKRNPAADYGYSVDMEGPGKSGLFVTKAVFKTAPDAKQYARALAKMYPSRTIRVMSGGRWIKR